MVKANAQLVTFNHGPVATEMTARAEADAVASFDMRRGLRLSAEARAEVEGHLTATIGNSPEHASTVATIEASLGVSARLALAAQLDVNGLWAEACGAAEARARVRGDIAVTGRILLDAIGADPAAARRHGSAPRPSCGRWRSTPVSTRRRTSRFVHGLG